MVFCHVEGTEVSQAVSTPEGNEQSKRNEEECYHVVRMSLDCCRFYLNAKRGLCCRPVSIRHSVCPAVCLSRWYIVSTAEDVVRLLSRPGSHIILVFFTPSAATQFQEESILARAQNTRGLEKNCDFRLKSPFISEMVRDRPILTIER